MQFTEYAKNKKNITFVGHIRAIHKWSGQCIIAIKTDNSQEDKRPSRCQHNGEMKSLI